jgi:hypothetical protein
MLEADHEVPVRDYVSVAVQQDDSLTILVDTCCFDSAGRIAVFRPARASSGPAGVWPRNPEDAYEAFLGKLRA